MLCGASSNSCVCGIIGGNKAGRGGGCGGCGRCTGNGGGTAGGSAEGTAESSAEGAAGGTAEGAAGGAAEDSTGDSAEGAAGSDGSCGTSGICGTSDGSESELDTNSAGTFICLCGNLRVYLLKSILFLFSFSNFSCFFLFKSCCSTTSTTVVPIPSNTELPMIPYSSGVKGALIYTYTNNIVHRQVIFDEQV